MLFFNITNTVLVALIQVGIIVAGILGCGVSVRWLVGAELPTVTVLLINYGVSLLAVPVVWTAGVLRLRQSDVADDIKDAAFVSGLVVAIGLLVLVLYGVVKPWTQCMWWQGDQ